MCSFHLLRSLESNHLEKLRSKVAECFPGEVDQHDSIMQNLKKIVACKDLVSWLNLYLSQFDYYVRINVLCRLVVDIKISQLTTLTFFIRIFWRNPSSSSAGWSWILSGNFTPRTQRWRRPGSWCFQKGNFTLSRTGASKYLDTGNLGGSSWVNFADV